MAEIKSARQLILRLHALKMYVVLGYSLEKLMEKKCSACKIMVLIWILFFFVCEVYQMHVFILIPIKAIRGSSKYEKKIMELHTYLYIYVLTDILTFEHWLPNVHCALFFFSNLSRNLSAYLSNVTH